MGKHRHHILRQKIIDNVAPLNNPSRTKKMRRISGALFWAVHSKQNVDKAPCYPNAGHCPVFHSFPVNRPIHTKKLNTGNDRKQAEFTRIFITILFVYDILRYIMQFFGLFSLFIHFTTPNSPIFILFSLSLVSCRLPSFPVSSNRFL